jgi:hypothetical protein
MERVPPPVLAQLLELLPARDVLQLALSCRALAPHSPAVREALQLVISLRFGDVTPFLRADDARWPRSLLTLRCAEVLRVKDLLARAAVVPFEDAASCRGTSVVVSKAWLVAWKRSSQVYEQFLLQFKLSKKKQQQQRARSTGGGSDGVRSGRRKAADAGSDHAADRALVDANAAALKSAGSMIVCAHDRLLPLVQCVGRSRRVILTRGTFKRLSVYAPELRAFPLASSADCNDCILEQDAREQEVEEKKRTRFEAEISGSDALVELLLRKTGYPTNLFAPRDTSLAPGSPRALSLVHCGARANASSYFLVPKKWLIKWRKFVRSQGDDVPGPILNSELVCLAHRRSVVPPYISMFLSGFSLEQSLRATQGCVRLLCVAVLSP